MAEILLSCSTEDLDNALTLKFQIQRKLGIVVYLEVEDDYSEHDEGFDAMIEQATVLLVFDCGDHNSKISAWITIQGIDNMADSNYVESHMPEKIDFKNVAKGIEILDGIFYNDFGLDLGPSPTTTDYKQYAYEQAQYEQAQHLAHEYTKALKV